MDHLLFHDPQTSLDEISSAIQLSTLELRTRTYKRDIGLVFSRLRKLSQHNFIVWTLSKASAIEVREGKFYLHILDTQSDEFWRLLRFTEEFKFIFENYNATDNFKPISDSAALEESFRRIMEDL